MAEGIAPRPYGLRDISAQITVNSDLLTIDAIKCYIVGNICIVNARLVTKTSISSNNQVFMSGFPKTVSGIKFQIAKYNGVNVAGIVSSLGDIRNDYSSFNENEQFFINIAYPTND